MKKILIGLCLMLGMSFAMSGSAAAAWNPFSDVGCDTDAGKKSAVCKDSQAQIDSGENPLTGSNGVIMRIANFIAFIAGAAAVIIIVLAGLRMVTSGGSSEDVAGARRALIYAAVGLAVIVLARVIIGIVINAL